MPTLLSCGIMTNACSWREEGGMPESGSAFFSCENPITVPAAGRQKHTPKPWSSLRLWATLINSLLC